MQIAIKTDIRTIIVVSKVLFSLLFVSWFEVDVGLGVGLEIGLGVGLEVGLGVGLEIGLGVGLEIGLGVGLEIGLGVGLEIGLGVGLEVGFSLGVWVGELLGLAVVDIKTLMLKNCCSYIIRSKPIEQIFPIPDANSLIGDQIGTRSCGKIEV